MYFFFRNFKFRNRNYLGNNAENLFFFYEKPLVRFTYLTEVQSLPLATRSNNLYFSKLFGNKDDLTFQQRTGR